MTASSLKVVDISTVNHSKRGEYLGGEKEGRQDSGTKRRYCLGYSFSLESRSGPRKGGFYLTEMSQELSRGQMGFYVILCLLSFVTL